MLLAFIKIIEQHFIVIIYGPVNTQVLQVHIRIRASHDRNVIFIYEYYDVYSSMTSLFLFTLDVNANRY